MSPETKIESPVKKRKKGTKKKRSARKEAEISMEAEN